MSGGRLSCPFLSPRVYSNSCPLSFWCHPTISSSITPFSSTLNFSQNQSLSQWVSSLHQVAKVLEFQLQHQSFQWIVRADFLQDWLVWSPCSLRDSWESLASEFENINSSVLSHFYGPTLTFIHDYWKNHSFDCIDLCRQSNVLALLYPHQHNNSFLMVKNLPANAGNIGGTGSIPGLGRSSWKRNGNTLHYSCPGKYHEQRSLFGYSPWGLKRVGHNLATLSSLRGI